MGRNEPNVRYLLLYKQFCYFPRLPAGRERNGIILVGSIPKNSCLCQSAPCLGGTLPC